MNQNVNKYLDRSGIEFYSRSGFKNKSQLDLQFSSAKSDITDRIKTHYLIKITDRSSIMGSQQEFNFDEKYKSENLINTFKAKYKFTLLHKFSMETGIELMDSKFNNNLRDTASKTNNSNFSDSKYNFREQVASTFMNINFSFNKWSYSIGLRDEYCLYKYSSSDSSMTYGADLHLTGISVNHYRGNAIGNYLYPNGSISYRINSKKLLALNFRQVNLRPGLNMTNSYTYSFSTDLFGNDKNPVTFKTSLADLSYIFQPTQNQTYKFDGGICYSTNTLRGYLNTFMPYGPGSYNFQIDYVNRKLYLSLLSQIIVNKWFTLGASFVVTDMRQTVKYPENKITNKYHPYEEITINGNIRLPKKVDFNFSYQFVSSYQLNNYYFNSQHYLNLVFKRNCLNNKVETFLVFTNPYHRLIFKKGSDSSFKSQLKTISEAAVFRIGASYKFGKK